MIMDGGMGTTLQSPPFELELGSALWSYQSSLPMFLPPQDSYTEQDVEQAMQTMLSALTLASSKTISSIPSNERERPQAPALALSLGPFGAQCQPGQEYSGLYPRPFGSKETPSKFGYNDSASQACGQLPLDAIQHITSTWKEQDLERDYLAAWHLQRLRHFSMSEAWSSIGVIAFETIPLLREVEAIRLAMHVFNVDNWIMSGLSNVTTPYYISFVFPLNEQGEPKFPDSDLQHLNLNKQIEQLIEQTFFGQLMNETKDLPNGFGINCTNPDHIEKIVEIFLKVLNERIIKQEQQQQQTCEIKPWIVLYPDGGAVYDAVFTKTWSNPTGMDETQWSLKLVNSIKHALDRRRDDGQLLLGGVVAGGCCKASPRYITALRKACLDRGLL
ncbi:AdoMet-homocysteine methyltransferase [Microbotryomycetes sp. JL221]|nr:AdoMet-homocysteine methyltransferase [Microbotryomycetes sp. JL221]